MAVLEKPNTNKLDPSPQNKVSFPCMESPAFRFLLAQERRLLKDILIRTPYALGDCVCAEPAIRFAANNFKECKISVVTPFPELYRHIPLKKVYNTKDGNPDWDKYWVHECYHAAEALHGEFIHNFNMSIDDYIAVCLFKGMIPVSDRNIVLQPTDIELASIPPQQVVIHAGKHWISKTFPKKWWDEVIKQLINEKIAVALVGAKSEDKRGYVEVNAEGCLDLRDKLTVMQSVGVLQRADVVLSNDSAPYHIAASGTAEIGVFSTVRHFDFIGHWRPMIDYPQANEMFSSRNNQWNYKIENLAKGQMWQNVDTQFGRNGAKYDVIDFQTLMSWLPTPEEVAAWALSKLGH
jgi:ADP-heptose:LPS heptosyltransferase